MKRDPAALTQKADALINAGRKQARAVRETVSEILQASGETSLKTSEVICGAITGAGAGAIAIHFLGLATLAAAASVPFIAVAGIGIGVLIVRGPRGIAADRRRQLQATELATAADRPRLLREEIAAAKAAGAPRAVLDLLWERYADTVAPPFHQRAVTAMEVSTSPILKSNNPPLQLPESPG